MSKVPSDNDSNKTQESNGGLANGSISAASTQAEMAKAFRDLAKGEQQAAALEASLTSFEDKLDALLASFEGDPTSSDATLEKKAGTKQREPETKN